MTIRIMTFSIMTLRIMAFSVTTLRIMKSIVMPNVIYAVSLYGMSL